MTNLGSLGGDAGPGNGLEVSSAAGVNDSGTIVGYSLLAGNQTYDAFIYENGTMTDLNSDVDLPGVTLLYAPAINDLGQIVALASNDDTYLLTPCGVPDASDTMLLMIFAMAGIWIAGQSYIRPRNTFACKG